LIGKKAMDIIMGGGKAIHLADYCFEMSLPIQIIIVTVLVPLCDESIEVYLNHPNIAYVFDKGFDDNKVVRAIEKLIKSKSKSKR